MRKIQLHKQAEKFLVKLVPKHQQQIARSLLGLQINPEPHDSKQLIGYNYLRVDVGEYRIIYDFTDTDVIVYVIGKRNDGDVYRKLDRL